jgi:hypothetical protein
MATEKKTNNAGLRKRERSEAVKKLVEKVEAKFVKELPKATLADYIRLIQLQKDLDEEEPKEIRVTWVDPEENREGGAEGIPADRAAEETKDSAS